jgi:hypothetical protein
MYRILLSNRNFNRESRRGAGKRSGAVIAVLHCVVTQQMLLPFFASWPVVPVSSAALARTVCRGRFFFEPRRSAWQRAVDQSGVTYLS